nr:zinc finger protein [Hymenolepis microstoma]
MASGVVPSDTPDNFCPICYDEITPPISTTDVCPHRFCYTCLKDWLDLHPSCPLDRKICSRIIVLPPENKKKRIRRWNSGDRLRIRAFWDNLDEPDISLIDDAQENDIQSENSDLAVLIETTEEDLIIFIVRLAGFVEKTTWVTTTNIWRFTPYFDLTSAVYNLAHWVRHRSPSDPQHLISQVDLNTLSESELNNIIENLSDDLHVAPFLDLTFAGVERETVEATDGPEDVDRKRRGFLAQLIARCVRLGQHLIDVLEDAFPSAMHERLCLSLSCYSF